VSRKPHQRTEVGFLNLLRGVAALLVAFGHARLMLVMDSGLVQPLSPMQKGFYFLTNLGGVSVLLFFILSGYLVGGSVISDIKLGRWNWRVYAIARISRLYVVLIPAIMIGILIDLIGSRCLSHSTVYSTAHYGFMLPESISANISWPIALGNLLALQEIFVPTLGSNHALWSLTNETWYYFIFPLFAAFFLPSIRWRAKVAFLLLGIGLLCILPLPISSAFGVWLLGAALALIPKMRVARYWAWLFSTALAIWIALQSAKIVESNQVITALLASLFIFCWLMRPVKRSSMIFRTLSSALSKISYSLYLFHTPLIVFVAALVIGGGSKHQPNLVGMGVTLMVLLLAIVYATGMWFLFERNTDRVRKALSNWFVKAPAPIDFANPPAPPAKTID